MSAAPQPSDTPLTPFTPPQIMKKAQERFTRARVHMVIKTPFFGMLAMKLRPVCTDNTAFKTMETDGRTINYDPNWVLSLTLDEVSGVIAHEVMHCAYLHPFRMQTREHMAWNYACDIVINSMLLDAGFTLPPEGVFDREKLYTNQSAERVYESLMDEREGTYNDPSWGIVNEATEDSNSSDNHGADDSSNDSDELSPQELEREWEQAVIQAAQSSKDRGFVPDDILERVERALKPKIDWKRQLATFMTSFVKDDYNWNRPNRRFISSGLYLPSAHSERLGRLCFAMDTSGSVSTPELSQFLSELNTILASLRPEAIDLMHVDTQIAHRETLTSEDLPLGKPVIYGRGGTSFKPVFDALKNEPHRPACLIYTTDGECDYQGITPPPFPVLWVFTKDPNQNTYAQRPPFGTLLILSNS